jgi:AcrR family transcriptional regulator
MAKRVGIDKDAVIRAAVKIADEHGWDALTLARVAKKLRIRSPSLYNHVGGLEALRRELKLLALRDLNTALSRATIGKSRDDAVRGLAAAYRAFVKRHPGTYAATMVAAPKNDPAMEAAASDIVETILSVLHGYGLDRREGMDLQRSKSQADSEFRSTWTKASSGWFRRCSQACRPHARNDLPEPEFAVNFHARAVASGYTNC